MQPQRKQPAPTKQSKQSDLVTGEKDTEYEDPSFDDENEMGCGKDTYQPDENDGAEAKRHRRRAKSEALKEGRRLDLVEGKNRGSARILPGPPDRLVVKDCNDNSNIYLSSTKMEELSMYDGDCILIKGKEGRDTTCVVLADNSCDVSAVRMNEGTRRNLRVNLDDDVIVVNLGEDIQYAKCIHISPLNDTIEGVTLRDYYLGPYFVGQFRPVTEGDIFVARSAIHCDSAEFEVTKIDPDTRTVLCHLILLLNV